MILFIYDHTFEGLLTCIFDAYFRKTFPDSLLMEGEPLPLFYDEAIHIKPDECGADYRKKSPSMPCSA